MHRAKSANGVGGVPVTSSTVLFGREPAPEAMVVVNARSTSAYSPAATLASIHASRSMWWCRKVSRSPPR